MEPAPLPTALRIALIAAAGMLAVVGAGGLATGAADNDDLTTAASRTTTTTSDGTQSTLGLGVDATTTTLAGSVAPGTTVKGSTATTVKAGGSTATTVAPVESNACASPPNASSDPGPIRPPAIGVYNYVSCGDDGAVDDQTVKEGNSAGGKVRRLVSRSRQGVQLTETVAYGAEGVVQEALNVSAFGQQAVCDWNPDILEYPAKLSVGTQWSAKSSCTTSFGRFEVDATGKVVGRRTVTVGGTPVNAWVVERRASLKTPQGDQVVDETNYYDTSRGVALYRKAVTSDGQGETITLTLRLASLTPRPL